MKFLASLQRRFGWVNLSTATLVALLQRTPVLRLAADADEWVTASPVGTLLKSAAAALGALGAIDSMAGATVLATTLTPNPTGALPTFDATVGTAITPLGFTITNTMNIGSWTVTGAIPPGLVLTTVEPNGGSLTGPGNLDATTPSTSGNGWSPGTTGNSTTTPVLKGTPTTAGTYTFMLQGFADGGEKGGSGATFVGTGISSVFSFTVQVAAAASPTPTPTPTPASSGNVPVFTTEPISVAVTGGTVALDAVASNSPAYQWMWNGTTPVAGATSSTLLLTDAPAAVGTYTCVATNAAGSVTSQGAVVSLTPTTDAARMVNISARAEVGTGSNIIFGGFAIGGAGVSGTQPVLIRGSGPAIAAAPFNVPGTLPDPQLQLFNSASAVLDTNDGWGGSATIVAEAAAVGAFVWTTPTSHDAALAVSLAPGAYTAQVAGESNDTGDSIMEVYDATPAGTATSASPRLVNLSARVFVGSGSNALFAGFVIKGSSAMTVLIRASGPALATFGVAGTLPDPQLTLEFQATGDAIASNDAWGGSAQISSTAAKVGAFAWTSASSHDSALLITLPPGNYTALVEGESGDTGDAIVEVYEVD